MASQEKLNALTTLLQEVLQENEANAQAAVIMRNWGKRFPRLFAQPAIE